MTLRVFPKIYGERTVLAGADQVIASIPLPANSTLNNIWGEVHMIGEDMTYLSGSYTSVYGYILPHLDPDTSITPDALFDRLVPKDRVLSAGNMDMDTTSTNANTQFQLNEMAPAAIYNLQNAPEQIWSREKLITAVTHGTQTRGIPDGGGVGDSRVKHMDFAKIRVSKRYRVRGPSYVVFAMGSPNFDQRETTWFAPSTEATWSLLQFLDVAVENAFLYLAGVSGGDGGTHVDECAAVLYDFMERWYEEDNDALVTTNWRVFTEMSFDVSIEGMPSMNTLSVQN
jgi:hypothetical protein